MKKFLFFVLICLATIQAKAVIWFETQYIKGLDEISIQGSWVVYESTQPEGEILQHLVLDGDNMYNSSISIRSKWDGDRTMGNIYYFITSCQTDNYVLHIMGDALYNDSLTKQKQYLIKKFIDNTMELTNFAGTYTIKLRREDASQATINIDTTENDSKMYNLNGQEITSPHGIYIQNGEKKIAK